jgi:hypothetical protein
MKTLGEMISDGIQFLYYSNKKRFIKNFEKNPKRYSNKGLLGDSRYCDTVADVEIYESLRELDKLKSNISTSVGTINLSTGKKTSLQQI